MDYSRPELADRLAAEYVLGTLPAAERQGVQQRLPGDKALQQAVAEWEARLLPLTLPVSGSLKG